MRTANLACRELLTGNASMKARTPSGNRLAAAKDRRAIAVPEKSLPWLTAKAMVHTAIAPAMNPNARRIAVEGLRR